MSSPIPRSGTGTQDTQETPDIPLPGQQWPAVANALPYGMLVFTCVLVVVFDRSYPHELLADLITSAVVAAWMLCVYTLHPEWRDRPRVMAVFVTVLLVIGTLLVVGNTLYGLWTFTIYVYVMRLRWPWPLIAGGWVALLSGVSQAYGVNKDTVGGALIFVVILAVNAGVAVTFIWFRRSVGVHEFLHDRAVDELSDANRRLEATLAENEGLQKQLLVQAREAGVRDERQRMAREIHDTLAQGLTGIITQLQAAEQAADDLAAWRRHFAAATRLARESLSEARRSVEALRPEALETARLSDALADVAKRWSALHGVAVEVTTTGTARPMQHQAEVALLRTAQEALANVAKHAQATRVGVTLSYMEHQVALDVRDDGKGFDLARLCAAAKGAAAKGAAANGGSTNGGAFHAGGNGNGKAHGLVGLSVGDGLRHAGAGGGQNGGFGLVAMRQRIEGLAGTLQVESEPGFGTGISACIPVAAGTGS
jgi:signal transduction histidine kinase